MLYVIAPTVPQAMALAAEVGEPRKTTVPITPRNHRTACRGYELLVHDTVLLADSMPTLEGPIDDRLRLMGATLTPDEQSRCLLLEWELR